MALEYSRLHQIHILQIDAGMSFFAVNRMKGI